MEHRLPACVLWNARVGWAPSEPGASRGMLRGDVVAHKFPGTVVSRFGLGGEKIPAGEELSESKLFHVEH